MHGFVLLFQKPDNHINSSNMLIQKSQNFIQYQEITFLCSNHFTG